MIGLASYIYIHTQTVNESHHPEKCRSSEGEYIMPPDSHLRKESYLYFNPIYVLHIKVSRTTKRGILGHFGDF